ncbi:hypothetical protein BDZ45DRAFT_131951 [Acephala macrosclerotiorum]|nr:hypothetical protein BDZ45DRAFT_131951 [Acephala macrosclerotiorum]
MPRRRPPQPQTPDNLPEIPQGATKKAYYPAGDLVYYLQDRKLRIYTRHTCLSAITSR